MKRRGRQPAWAVGAGLLGLSLVTTWAVASQIRNDVAVAEPPAPMAMAQPIQEVAQPVRTVGVAQAPQAALVSEPSPVVETSLPTSTVLPQAEPQPMVPVASAPAVPVSKPERGPKVDLGALPVLTLDETAFETVQAPASEAMPQTATRAQGRP